MRSGFAAFAIVVLLTIGFVIFVMFLWGSTFGASYANLENASKVSMPERCEETCESITGYTFFKYEPPLYGGLFGSGKPNKCWCLNREEEPVDIGRVFWR